MPEPVFIETAIKRHQITHLKLSDPAKENKIKHILSCLDLTKDQISGVANLFCDLLKKGLLYNGTSPFNMQNTFISNLLEGNESGKFLALDFGGTNFRVLLIELQNGQLVKEEKKKYDVPGILREGKGVELFEFLATCLADFASIHGISRDKIPLGFTFSFPTVQYSIDSASLQHWIGLYNVSDVVGKDVVKMLNEAISQRTGLNVPVVAVLNDTVGVLVRGSMIDEDTGISLILGTGSNACYFERTECMASYKGEEKEVALNIEWGPFSDEGRGDIIKTKYDKIVDDESLHPNVFTFEKYVGGEFFGKLVRAIILDLVSQNLMFEGRHIDALVDNDKFEASYISEIEHDNLKNSNINTRGILVNELEIDWCSEDDIAILRYICELVSIRMALLASIALSEIVKRMNRSQITIAVDGSVYKYHPRMHNYITDFTSALVGNKAKVKLILAEDGSGVGAALIAALVFKQKSGA